MKSNKTRSRKSKLVPRECLDSDDENIANMQNEIEQTIARMTSNSILKKLNRHTEEPLKFSIKVEVEEVDEPVNNKIKQEETEGEMNISIDSVVSLKELNTDKKNKIKCLQEKTTSPAAILCKEPEVMQCVLKERMIRKEFNRISKQTTSKADKLIEIHILNWDGKYSREIEVDDKELQLQTVIEKWKNWHKTNSKHRDIPLSYKCYICSKAWWHYYDFRQHFNTHDVAVLDIESCGQECNVIAYQNEQPDYDIPIDETCWRCGQDFSAHQIAKKGNKIYRCSGCLERFITCMLLNEHLGSCQFFKRTLDAEGVKTNEVFSCTLCPVKYFSNIELDKHLKRRHSVRSDLPVVVNVKNCPTCNRQFIEGYSHECDKLLFKKSCKFCKRIFQKSTDLQMHETVVSKYHKCAICGKILLAECMELEHLFSHSTTYSMVYKCRLCPNFVYFVNEFMMKKHKLTCHKQHNIDINNYFSEMIVVPKTLLKNTPLKTYVPKIKLKSNINDQQVQENTNGCEGLEIELLGFNECDSKNYTNENVTKSKKGEININMEKAKTKIKTLSTNIEEDATNIDDGATNIDEDATNIDDGATNIDEVDTNIDEVSTNSDGASTNMAEASTKIDIRINNFESINIKIKKEKPEIEEIFNDEFSNEIILTQEPMEMDFNINYYNKDNINDMVVKEEIIEHVVKVCDLSSDIKIEVKDEPMDYIDYNLISDNDYGNNYTTNDDKNDEDFKLIHTSKTYSKIGRRKALLKQQNKHQEPDTTVEIATEYFLSAGSPEVNQPSEISTIKAERSLQRQHGDGKREKKESPKKQPKSAAQRMREYRQRKKTTIVRRKIYSCKKCPYKGIHKHYKEHMKGRCRNSFYTCTKCNSNHLTMKDYLCHFQQHNYLPYTCPKCLKQLPVMGKLTTHVYQHIKNNFVGVRFIKDKAFNNCYQCRLCRVKVVSSDFFMHWESHIEIKSLETKSTTTDLMEKKPILMEVIATLQDEIPEISKELQAKQCLMCFKNFSRKNDLKRHLIEHLLKDAYVNRDKYECLKCQICSVGFNKIDIYKRHMRDHGSLPLYKCEICDKTFSDSSNFSKHKKVHNLSVLICDKCKKKFTCKAFLIKHMEMHDKVTPIVCECCRRVFHSPSLYRKHRNGRYRFKCPVCILTFDSLKEKWDHMWLEHKERKYLADCPICKKSFRKYQDVKMHIKTIHDSKYVYKPTYVKINKNEEVIVCE